MEHLFNYDLSNLDLDKVPVLTIDEKIYLLTLKKELSNLLDVSVENDMITLNSNNNIFHFSLGENTSSLVSKKEILIVTCFEIYKYYNIDGFNDDNDLIELINYLKLIFGDNYTKFILLYTLYYNLGKFSPQW